MQPTNFFCYPTKVLLGELKFCMFCFVGTAKKICRLYINNLFANTENLFSPCLCYDDHCDNHFGFQFWIELNDVLHIITIELHVQISSFNRTIIVSTSFPRLL